MNDISKTQTVSRLNKAIESEGLKVVEAAACIGIRDTYISMMRNVKSWGQCPLSAWEAALAWVNSGQSLKEYQDKHGKVLPPVKHIELPPKVVAVKQPETKDVEIKIKPEAYERRIKELAEKQSVKEERQKISIDIEINLIINGKRISL